MFCDVFTGRKGDEEVTVFCDVFTGRKPLDQAAIKFPAGGIVDPC